MTREKFLRSNDTGGIGGDRSAEVLNTDGLGVGDDVVGLSIWGTVGGLGGGDGYVDITLTNPTWFGFKCYGEV
jgi:hypothetical protein